MYIFSRFLLYGLIISGKITLKTLKTFYIRQNYLLKLEKFKCNSLQNNFETKKYFSLKTLPNLSCLLAIATMDLESKISSLKNYAKLSTQDDRETAHKHDYQETSNGSTESSGWWGSMSNKAQEPDPWLPGLVFLILHFK